MAKTTREFHDRIQDVLLILHGLLRQYPVNSQINFFDVKAKIGLCSTKLTSALVSVSPRSRKNDD
jgi:hypothetical protein